MKRTSLVLMALAFGALALGRISAEETQTTAKVLKITGSAAQVILPGASAPVALNVGDDLPQGATIITGDGTDVYVQPMTGTVSTIKANTRVEMEKLSVTMEGSKLTKQSALLNLRSGNLVSSLDPSRKAVNDYGVRTPKGVAAARGTVYHVNVNGTNYTVTTGAGTVSISAPGQPDVSVAHGQVSVSGIAGGASLAANDPQLAGVQSQIASALTVATAAVATVAQNPTVFSQGSSDAAAGELTNVIQTVVQAVPAATSAVVQAAVTNAPSQTTAVVQQAVTTATASNGGADSQASANAVSQIAAAAATANPTAAASIASTATTAAPAAAAQIASSTAAVAPAQAANIASSVTTAASAGGNSAAAATIASSVAATVPGSATQIASAVATSLVNSGNSSTEAQATVVAAVAQATNTTVSSVATAVATATGGDAAAATTLTNSANSSSVQAAATQASSTATTTATQATQSASQQQVVTQQVSTATNTTPTTNTPAPNSTPTTPTTPTQPTQPTQPTTTTPQPIDPSTVSRSG